MGGRGFCPLGPRVPRHADAVHAAQIDSNPGIAIHALAVACMVVPSYAATMGRHARESFDTTYGYLAVVNDLKPSEPPGVIVAQVPFCRSPDTGFLAARATQARAAVGDDKPHDPGTVACQFSLIPRHRGRSSLDCSSPSCLNSTAQRNENSSTGC